MLVVEQVDDRSARDRGEGGGRVMIGRTLELDGADDMPRRSSLDPAPHKRQQSIRIRDNVAEQPLRLFGRQSKGTVQPLGDARHRANPRVERRFIDGRNPRPQRRQHPRPTARRSAQAELTLGRERERADRALQIQAVRFGAALGNMSEILCLFDSANRLIVGNDRLGAMLGLSAGIIASGMTIEDIGALAAGASDPSIIDQQELLGLILCLKDAGRPDSKALDMANGRRIAANFALMDNDGWLVTLEDMTEQRRSEA